jgi:drug/metabolite transporter (DMT)-like permease
MPIMTILLAHFLVENERLNRYKVLGCVLSFCGVALLLAPQLEVKGSAIAQLAVFGAATCYALQTILIRLLPKFDPIVAGAGMLIAASLLSLPAALIAGFSNVQEISRSAVYAIIWLGIIPTGCASILFFTLVERTGPSFISNVNYLIPVVAFFSGIVILNEPLTTTNLVAVAIIISGVALTRKPVKVMIKRSVK